MLTLANGQKIDLTTASAAQSISQHTSTIQQIAAGQVIYQPETPADHEKAGNNTITTPNGGQWQVVLSDGTKVWLNAASSISYPSTFAKRENRIVVLTGEAYFEVAKDASHPFIVISGNQRIEVLGTHFNISSYTDDPAISTTLLEGSVKVSLSGQKHDVYLKPGEQALSSKQGIRIRQVDVTEALAWKEGYFRFDDEPITSIMSKLARWYDIEVHYQDTTNKEAFYGRVSRNKNLSQVLKALETTKTVQFKVEGRRVTVLK